MMRNAKIHFWDETKGLYVESDFGTDLPDCYCGSPAVIISECESIGFAIKCSSDFSILKCCNDSYQANPDACLSTTADNIASVSKSWVAIINSITQFSKKECL